MKLLFLKSISLKATLIFVLILVFGFIGCGKDDYSSTAPASNPGANEIFMQNMSFSSSNLTISVGTTIKWTNKDNFAHTVTSGEPNAETGLFDSGNLGQNKAFSFTFTQAGTFKYFCKIHPSQMRATITVQ